MAKVPKKVVQRLLKEVPAHKKILEQAKSRDVNEADTVTIVVDLLNNVFGFDKYSEITRELQIKGTYCDLAIKINDQVEYLIEVKAVGTEIGKENHVRQAVDYAAKEGIRWVILTNAIDWQLYRMLLKDKVEHDLVYQFNILELNPRNKTDQELLFMLCRRAIDKDLAEKFYEYQQLVNKYTVAGILMSDETHALVTKNLRKLMPGIKVDNQEIAKMIKDQVIKRELAESDISKATVSKIKRTKNKALAAKKKSVVSNELNDGLNDKLGES